MDSATSRRHLFFLIKTVKFPHSSQKINLFVQKAEADAPNYRAAAQPQQSCSTCVHYDGAFCDLYNFPPRADWVCDSFEDAGRGGGAVAKASVAVDGLRWTMITATAHQDRDGEWIAKAALEADCERCDADGSYGPLEWWHATTADGTPLSIGQCDFNMVAGDTLIESGTFATAEIAKAMADSAETLGGSIVFFGSKDNDNTFRSIYKTRRGLAPLEAVRNGYSKFYATTENRKAMNGKQLSEFVSKFPDADTGFDQLANVLNGAQAVEDTAAAQGNVAKAKEPDTGSLNAILAGAFAAPTIEKADSDMSMQDFATLITNGVGSAVQKALAPVVEQLGKPETTTELTATVEQTDLGAQITALEAKVAELTKPDEGVDLMQKAADKITALEAKVAELSGDVPSGVWALKATDGAQQLNDEQIKALAGNVAPDFSFDAFVESM